MGLIRSGGVYPSPGVTQASTMPVLDTIRKTLRREGKGTETVRCETCGADFSLTRAESAVDVECPYCGSTEVRVRG